MMTDFETRRATLGRQLGRFPRAELAHTPTPLEPMANLSAALGGPALWVKRDDCTGLAFGGNKARQLEYYFGAAQAAQADAVLITGAVQSNYVRMAAAAARKLAMTCHIQLEDRVPNDAAAYQTSGNVLLDRLLGATLSRYADGEDEAGADAELRRLAERLRREGHHPYIILLGPDAEPLGALGYVRAAIELAEQCREQDLEVGEIFVASGSSFTHAGLLYGLRALGLDHAVTGVCVRREAARQRRRVGQRVAELARLLALPVAFEPEDIRLTDATLAPGYGRLNEACFEALELAALNEGLLLDPVYTAKTLAGMIHCLRRRELAAPGAAVFIHTGGGPALFAYADDLDRRLKA
jgi:D-cysteine desulfhydrase/L-cysteate sulfo-lyase